MYIGIVITCLKLIHGFIVKKKKIQTDYYNIFYFKFDIWTIHFNVKI